MIDPKMLAIPAVEVTPKPSRAPRHRSGQRFLRGPIPWDWLCAASAAAGRGSGFQVAIGLWYLSGLNRQSHTIKLTSTVMQEMGIERHAIYRGLTALEKAGLVTVVRHPGRLPVVTLLPIPQHG